MSKTLSHGGVEYNIDLLLSIKGQGTNIRVKQTECVTSDNVIIDDTIKKPILVNTNGQLTVIIDTPFQRNEKPFDAVLLSKHILKKAKVVVPEKVNARTVDNRTPAQKALAVLNDRAREEPDHRQERRFTESEYSYR